MDPDIGDTLDTARETAEDVAETVTDTVSDHTPAEVERLREAGDEATSMADEINVTQLAQAINISEVPDALDDADLNDVITERDVADVLDVDDVPEAVDADAARNAMDVRGAWRHARRMVAALKGEDERDVEPPDVSDEAVDEPDDLDQFSQLAVQKKASKAVDEFREELLKARARLKALHDTNVERTTPDSRQPSSRSPTAVSTVPSRNSGSVLGLRGSTVPEETKYSTAPNRPRIYGSRFEEEGDG
ncbi:hypothetical protein [Haladaptatus sp. DJG-WS-42]|uniref:hypothetical protein n=1 Tax=Haladaptatus sp. DJG-WS-42 TaxID=3120516 RepID=UPI0030CE070E